MTGSKKLDRLVYTGHALRQMFLRDLSANDIRIVVENGERIADYPEDRPYPSELLLGSMKGRPIHVVLGYDEAARTGYVVTTYVPDPKLWSDDFRTRRTS